MSEELARLRREVKSHAEFEESQLFPALARVLGDRPPEVDRLVQEHRELSAQLDALDQAMNTRDAGAVCAQLVAFAKAFDAHSLDEADILDTTANIMEPGGPAA